MIRTRVFAILLLLVTVSFAGCFSNEDEGEGRVAVYVKDAATDEFSQLFITFSKVAIHQGDDDGSANGDQGQDGAEPETEGADWTTVFEGSKEIDLMAFSATDARAFLGDANLSAGTYNQIVITVDEARGVMADDGSEVDITVTTGWVRVVRAFEVTEDETTRIIVDLDLDRSVVQQGPNGWRLNPVIGQVIVEDDATGDEGSTRGTGGAQGGGGAGGAGGADGRTATLNTYVKDAPTDEFSEIWIRFDTVTVHRAGGDGTGDGAGNGTGGGAGDGTGDADNGTNNDTEDEDTGGSWIVVFDGDRAIDLLRFAEEGSKAFLGSEEVMEGRYTQIRVNITEAWGIQDGENVTIQVAQTEAKIVRSFEVEANATTQLVIDLDLDRSLVRQGGPGGQGNVSWRMTPVIGSVRAQQVDDDPQVDMPDDA